MAFPPAQLPNNKTNATAQLDDHPGHHNAIANAVNDVVGEMTDTNRDVDAGQVNVTGLSLPPSETAPRSGALIEKTGRITSIVNDPSGVGSPSLSLIRTGAPGTDGGVFIRFARTSASTVAGSVTIAAGGGVSYNQTSDPRRKQNVGPITDAAARVKTLGGNAFRGHWLEDPDHAEHDFLSSHDIEDAAPYATIGERDGEDPQMVDFGRLVPLLTAALADALERLDAAGL